jgi:hypothetical protein
MCKKFLGNKQAHSIFIQELHIWINSQISQYNYGGLEEDLNPYFSRER